MRFFESQAEARRQTRRLLVLFGLTVLLLLAAVNAALALAWGLSWAFWMPGPFSLPARFIEINTAVVLLFVLGGWWLETSRLQSAGGAALARQLGAREARPAGDFHEQRYVHIVDEMAIASGLPAPAALVLPREGAINALAAGWDPTDAAIAVTQGALDHLSREEMQGLVAHELSHIGEGDTRLNMRLCGMVFGLEMVYRLGQDLWEADDEGRRHAAALAGLALMAAGWPGWMAGHALQAAVARQREYLADARAVQWTRSRDALGGVLRTALAQRERGDADRTGSAQVQHMLLLGSEAGGLRHWFDAHPPLAQRIRRIYGRPMAPLPLGGAERRAVTDPTA